MTDAGASVRSRRRRWPLIAGTSAAVLAAAMVGAGQLAFAATTLNETFESGSTSGWSKSGGTWSVVTDGSKVLRQSNANSDNARNFAGSSATDYTVRARVKPLSLGSGGHVGLLARANGSSTFFRLALLPGNRAELQAVKSGAVTVLGGASRPVATGTWYTLSIELKGTTISGSVDGTPIGSGTSSVSKAGRIGVQTAKSTASFDDVKVDTSTGGGGGGDPSPKPSASKSSDPKPPPTTGPPPPPGPGNPPPPPGTWPTKRGDAPVNGTIRVSGTFDGELKRFCCIGDGGQGESQDPVFVLAPGATLKNVILGAPAGDGVHCDGDCRLENVWWEDVGEDAATFRGGTNYQVLGGGARSASDKVFQHNGAGTVRISNFQAENIGKLYRACGNCSASEQRHVVMDNVTVTNAKILAGININFGDTAKLTNITVRGKVTACAKFEGAKKGSEPRQVGSGPDPKHCLYSETRDIRYL